MKQIPNIITGIRIIFAMFLLFLKPLSTTFFVIYLLGGISDILDGFIARKMNITTKFGALLDSIADLVFTAVLAFIFIPLIEWSTWIIIWVVGIAVVRFISLAVGYIKYKTIAFLHTYANKTTGLMLFAFPLLYHFWGLNITTILLCCISTISAIEEISINIVSTTLNRDITSIFALCKKN